MASPKVVQRNASRTRNRLLQAAIRLFAARGYHGVSVDEVVAVARVNKRMVYHYFGSKQELFRAALRQVYGRLETVEFHAVERGSSPRERLTRLLESYFEFLDHNPEFTRLLQWENLEKGEHIRKRKEAVLTKNPFLERFRQIVEGGIESGEFRPDINIPHLLIHLIGLCFIYHSNRFSLSQGLNMDLGDPKVKAQALAQVLQFVFKGISSPPPAARPALAVGER
ncbi:MAG: TetR/AcrR family transcriptional regulator [Opitutaceae bacterium]|nr:TetR/AcrR family transcriptional regulator [Opitutaceae bacterium]